VLAPSSTRSSRASIPNCDEELAITMAGFSCIAGLDEVGRGAWAGPVVAAAVILPAMTDGVPATLSEVNDSKLLSPAKRAALYPIILGCARSVGVGAVAASELDLLGLTAAGDLAMLRAVQDLELAPDFLLIDAFRLRASPLPQKGIVHGDARCISVAAASVVAKVVRDRLMCGLDGLYPEYGFAQHKGYGVAAHRRALARHGPTRLHRRSYAPLRELAAEAAG
jgi:ribonuclease HII